MVGKDKKHFKMQLNDHRRYLLGQLEERLLPRIDKNSKTAAVEKAMELALQFLDLREEREEEWRKREQNFRENIEEEKSRWEI